MKSEKALAFLDRKCPKREHPVSGASFYGLLSRYDAERAIALAEEDAAEKEQALREKFAADIKALLDKWDTADRKMDGQWQKEVDACKADIEKYKREISELKQRLAIAEKIIAGKNKELRR